MTKIFTYDNNHSTLMKRFTVSKMIYRQKLSFTFNRTIYHYFLPLIKNIYCFYLLLTVNRKTYLE